MLNMIKLKAIYTTNAAKHLLQRQQLYQFSLQKTNNKYIPGESGIIFFPYAKRLAHKWLKTPDIDICFLCL